MNSKMLKFIKIKFLIIYYLYKSNNALNGIIKDNPFFLNLIDNATLYGDNNGLISVNLIQIKQIKVKIIVIIKKIIWK